MSDLAPQFYNAFCTVNQYQPKWLYCTWHVDKNWQEEIHKKVKAKKPEDTKLVQVYLPFYFFL